MRRAAGLSMGSVLLPLRTCPAGGGRSLPAIREPVAGRDLGPLLATIGTHSPTKWASSALSPVSVAATWRSTSAPQTRSSTCVGAASCCPSPRWWRSTPAAARCTPWARGQADAGPHAGHDPGDPAAEGRRDRRLRRHRADAAPLHPEGAPEPLGAPARRRVRAVRGDRRREAGGRGGMPVGRRPPGLPDRGADGGRDRRRLAGRRADRATSSSTSAAARARSRSSRSAGSSSRSRSGSAATRWTTAIVNYVKREYKLMIGQQTAEEIKLEIGSAFPLPGGGAGGGPRPRPRARACRRRSC